VGRAQYHSCAKPRRGKHLNLTRLDPLESAHIFCYAEPVPSKGTLQFLSASASRDAQGRCVKRVKPKEVAMGAIALGGHGPP